MVEFEIPDVDYTRYSNRQLIAIPLALLGLALVILIGNAIITGTSPVSLGVAFTGGTELRVQTADTQPQIERTFDAETESIAPIRAEQNEYIVTLPPSDADPQSQAEAAGYEVISSQERAASFGADTQRQAFLGIGIAFVGMALLVFGLFRTFIPSIAVIASAFSDIVIPVALMSVLDISLTLGTVAALLMLIGYSVDSDLLLNNHILRRRGDFYESTYRAMQTGVTMTLTSIAAMTAMTITARVLGINLLPSVGLILVFGLITDLMNTYLLNVSLLRYYKYEAVAR
ncbi:preprotein translocase subunit SecF [Halobacteriales archaeon SW_8_65_20]|nr:MAG: preprotein translocase subunit SecF [Halobacteriales archaeon QH_7_65_31]PSQ32010.1 MAG: preprotein translocase subunit SecF [Halobacteriales archaeon SW_6_65_46]PSQ52983.1 MAG: preprotein translocase subunit SecF [Halobacteriales archaeon SW_8_65_20]